MYFFFVEIYLCTLPHVASMPFLMNVRPYSKSTNSLMHHRHY